MLLYLHQQTPPIIFRDLKPANVMIDEQANIFLIDFGIARLLKEDQLADTHIFISQGYAAPEQYGLEQNGTSQTTAQSDLYSLGATLHHCLTAKRPMGIADRFRFASVSKNNAHVPAQLDQLIQRLVVHDPQQRPTDAWEVKQELLIIQQAFKPATKVMTNSSGQGPLHLGKSTPSGHLRLSMIARRSDPPIQLPLHP